MKLDEFRNSQSLKFWIRPRTSSIPFRLGPVRFRLSDTEGIFNLLFDDQSFNEVVLRNESSLNGLYSSFRRGLPYLAEIVNVEKDNRSAEIAIVFFGRETLETGKIEIQLDDNGLKSLKKRFTFNSMEELTPRLVEKCVFHQGSDDFFLIGIDRDREIDVESESQDAEATLFFGPRHTFTLFGEGLRIDIRQNDDDVFCAIKVRLNARNSGERALYLVRGTLSFSGRAEKAHALTLGQLSRLVRQKRSYLKKWDEYLEIEGTIIMDKAKRVGILRYRHGSVIPGDGTVTFNFSEPLPPELSNRDALELTSEIPEYLADDLPTDWKSFFKDFQNSYFQQENNHRKTEILTIRSLTSHSICVRSSSPLLFQLAKEKNRFLVLSLLGDASQINRRMKARDRILKDDAGMRDLGLILEGLPSNSAGKTPKIPPITSFVAEKIFPLGHTGNQQKAIDFALNTRDITLIQGPPGTGKTTVIAAILERLNEEHDKSKPIQGQTLVSCFQHDAVENLIARLRVNTIPPKRFGGRWDRDEESLLDRHTRQWYIDIAAKIHEAKPEIKITEETRELNRHLRAHLLNPSLENAKNLLHFIETLPHMVLGKELVDEVVRFRKQLYLQQMTTPEPALRLVRSLRLTEAGFLDDGKEIAQILVEDYLESVLRERLDSKDIRVLELAARWKTGNGFDFLEELAVVKSKLLCELTPKPEYRREKHRNDIMELFEKVDEKLRKHLSGSDQVNNVLANYLFELENNPEGVMQSIKDYSFVYVATTQQAGGGELKKAKTNEDNPKVEFDTVIVDEAGRVSPLDILIPMSQAVKRIILVGDHRQLPHMVDDEIARRLEEGEGPDEFGESMFKRLFSLVENLEKDGTSRKITLNKQFRMPKLLGDFVSNNFYAKHGEAFESCTNVPAGHFDHHLPWTAQKNALWIDAPNFLGDDRRSKESFSRIRECEAEIIAVVLARWLQHDAEAKLSFGVISFYKDQIDLIFEKLEKMEIAEKDERGEYRIVEKYRHIHVDSGSEERLRIGTVDAFQGMEFDAVLLSMVRSSRAEDTSTLSAELLEKRQRQVFGHLLSENRLCVSMSRQKKLLAVVGDSDLVRSPLAAGTSVEALGRFYTLCRDNGNIEDGGKIR